MSGAGQGPRGAIDWLELERRALAVRHHAHAPYSGYQVGAALLVRSGAIFTGCNVENASYGLSLCAERSAVAAMVSQGETGPLAIVVVTRGPKPGTPCGMCRQVLAEFADDALMVRLLVDGVPGQSRDFTLGALLPEAFRRDSL